MRIVASAVVRQVERGVRDPHGAPRPFRRRLASGSTRGTRPCSFAPRRARRYPSLWRLSLRLSMATKSRDSWIAVVCGAFRSRRRQQFAPRGLLQFPACGHDVNGSLALHIRSLSLGMRRLLVCGGSCDLLSWALCRDAGAKVLDISFLVGIIRIAPQAKWQGDELATMLYPEGFADHAKPSGKSVYGMKREE